VVAMLGSRHGRSARTTAFLNALRQSLTPPPWRRKQTAWRKDASVRPIHIG